MTIGELRELIGGFDVDLEVDIWESSRSIDEILDSETARTEHLIILCRSSCGEYVLTGSLRSAGTDDK